jgi:hypothetical protein
MTRHCPLCSTPLTSYPPIAICCDNPTCPVEDDCDLWYVASDGTWKKQEWMQTPTGPNQWYLTLTEKV